MAQVWMQHWYICGLESGPAKGHTVSIMDIITQLRQDFRDARRGEIERVADKMGVPRGTLRKIVAGYTDDPRYSTVQRIADYYRRIAVRTPVSGDPPVSAIDRVA